jgi:hypothetical protein
MKNATFNFNFGGASLPARRSSRKTPAKLPARPSSRKTPQPLAPRLSTRKTPATTSTKAGERSGKSRRSASVAESVVSGASNAQSRDTTRAIAGQVFKTPTVTGKRKREGKALDSVQEAEHDELDPTEEDIMESRGQSIRQSIEGPFTTLEHPSVLPGGIEDDEDDELSPEQLERSRVGEPTPTATSTLQTPSLAGPRRKSVVGERRVSQKLVRGRSRTRKSITAANASAHVSQLDIASGDELSPRNQTTNITAQSDSRAQGSISGVVGDSLSTSEFVPNNQSTRREVYEAADAEEDELTPPQPKKRTERVDITEVEAEAGASDDELSPKPLKQSKRSGGLGDQSIHGSAENISGPASDDELTPKLRKTQKKRGRPSAVSVQVREDTQDHASGDELSPQQRREEAKKRGRPPLSKTTANATKPPSQYKAAERATSPATKKRKATTETSTGTVPITVYRRTKPQDIDDDPFGADPTPGLNPADVLAQISNELANAYISTFTSTQSQIQSQSQKKTRQRQINALITFRDSLSDSLFDLTIAQNTTFILGMRVRKANKEKRRLREELIARRREREEVELKIDAVRARRQNRLEKEMRRHDLVQSLEDIELALKRGREKARREEREDEGPLVGVAMLASEAFGMIGNGGILGRVRDWNSTLEEAAEIVEARA